MIRKIKTSRNKNQKTSQDFLGEELLGPQASLRVIPLFADPNLTYHVAGERLFGPQASLRITPMR